MQSLISVLRSVIGNPPDYFTIGQSSSPQWDYGLLLEYAFAGILLVLTISFVYKILINLSKGR